MVWEKHTRPLLVSLPVRWDRSDRYRRSDRVQPPGEATYRPARSDLKVEVMLKAPGQVDGWLLKTEKCTYPLVMPNMAMVFRWP